MREIECLTCKAVIVSGRGVQGCQCDPDLPTWCALDGDRLMTCSLSKYREH